MIRKLLIATTVAALFWWQNQSPLQATVTADGGYGFDGYVIEPVRPFAHEARVLHRRNYHAGREADLSPTDLALGWGPMSTDAVLQHVDISQRNRFYYWPVEQFPIPRREIETHSTNVHIIPASPAVAAVLEQVRRDDTVRLAGQLVNVRAADGWRWRSSTTFEDTGDGACELLWLEQLEIL